MQSLLLAYATNEHMKVAAADFKELRQQQSLTEDDYFEIFQAKNARAGWYLAEPDQVAAFIEGLRRTIRPQVRKFHTANPFLGLLKIKDFAKAEGEAICTLKEDEYDVGKGGLPCRTKVVTAAVTMDETGMTLGPMVAAMVTGHPCNADER